MEGSEVLQEEAVGANSSSFVCQICTEPMSLSSQFKNPNRCVHPFCTECIIKHIQAKLEDNVANIKCPALDCEQFLDPPSCRPVMPTQLFVKWCDVLVDTALLGFDRSYCPYRDCSALVVNECGGRKRVTRCVCPCCKGLFCFRCKVRWHAGFRCEESGVVRDAHEVAFGWLAELKRWRRCPECRHFVEHIGGCSDMRCRCGTSFCYKCGMNIARRQCKCRPHEYDGHFVVFLLVTVTTLFLFIYLNLIAV